MTKAHIDNHFLSAAIVGAMRLGIAPEELFKKAKIPWHFYQNVEQGITEQQLTQLVKAVWSLTKDEFMGFASMPSYHGCFALMAEYCLSAATLGGMLTRSVRFYRTICPSLSISLELNDESAERVFFEINLADSSNDPDHFLQEFLLLMWQRFSCWLVAQQIPITTTVFNYSQPAHFSSYQKMFNSKLVFSHSTCGFYLHRRYLQLPLVRTRIELTDFLKNSPAYILHRPKQDLTLRGKVRLYLSEHDYQHLPSMSVLAKDFSQTPRAISRKLKEEGASYSLIKDELLRDYAMKLLTTEHLTIAEVGHRVGFSETVSFCRAFKRWTGTSPKRWGSL